MISRWIFFSQSKRTTMKVARISFNQTLKSRLHVGRWLHSELEPWIFFSFVFFFTCRITRLHHLILNIGALVPYNHTVSACLQHCHSLVEFRTVHNGISNRTRSVYYLHKITIKMAWKINWINYFVIMNLILEWLIAIFAYQVVQLGEGKVRLHTERNISTSLQAKNQTLFQLISTPITHTIK